MDEGTALEPTILDILLNVHDFHFVEDSRQHKIEINCGAFNNKTLWVRGAVDAIVWGGGNARQIPVDVKAFTNDDAELFHNRQFDHPGFRRYAYQQSAYAIGCNTDHFIMPIFNKGTWQVERWSLVPHRIVVSREEIIQRVLDIEQAYSDLKMPQECPSDFGCPYPYLHDSSPREDVPEAAQRLVDARISLSQKIRTLEAARLYLDGQIAKHLTEGSTYTHDGHTVSLLHKPARFNIKAAQQLLTDADIDWQHDPDYIIPGEGTYIRVTPPKKPTSA
jgi:hypothetical protein